MKQFKELKTRSIFFRDVVRLLYLALITALLLVGPLPTRAGVIEDLQSKINGRSDDIAKLEEEIAQYKAELDKISTQKDSLQTVIARIDVTRKKLAADIKVTENKIAASNLSIQKLTFEIGGKQDSIVVRKHAVGESLRTIDEFDHLTLAELVLHAGTVSDFWDDLAQIQQFNRNAEQEIKELTTLKESLEVTKSDVEKEKANLLTLNRTLSDQKVIADAERAAQNKLLSETKNKESNYKTILAQKEALRREFEQELFDLESQLRITIDPNSLPPSRHGILFWPISPVRITQYFGDTDFAKTGAYSGKGHNGIDFGAPVGTPIKSALSGTVIGYGDTDKYPKCYSYGKWILVKHDNGLSTLYAHLSLIRVVEGQRVGTGDLIGYSGNTGYSTGPHLHFTVFASQGVEIRRLGDIKKITNCGDAYMPVAPLNAYLDPMSYL